MELAAARRHYHAPITRTAHLGTPPSEVRKLASVIVEGGDLALEAARPGATCAEVEVVWQGVLNRHGYQKESRVGYSIGLGFPPDWGERTASLRPGDTTVLEPGMCFHFQSGIWNFPVDSLTDYGCPASSFRCASIRAARSKSLSRRRRMVARRSSRSSTRVRSLAISREASSWRRSCAAGCGRARTVASFPTRAAAYRASASASASRASTSASFMSWIHPKRASDDTVRKSGTLDVRVSRTTSQPALFIATPRTPRARMTRPGYSVPTPLRKHSTKAMS